MCKMCFGPGVKMASKELRFPKSMLLATVMASKIHHVFGLSMP